MVSTPHFRRLSLGMPGGKKRRKKRVERRCACFAALHAQLSQSPLQGAEGMILFLHDFKQFYFKHQCRVGFDGGA